MTNLVFIDTETTSLRADRRAWEIALIVRDGDEPDAEYAMLIDDSDLDLGNADLISLKIGRFYDRHPRYNGDLSVTLWSERTALQEVERQTRDAILVGAVPNFDAEVLGARMRAHGICPSWRYHLVDVETLAAGRLDTPPPWDFDKMLAAFGLVYDEADRHTALGDARMVRDLYDVILGGAAPREAS
jgi:DNA polymerase III epsilon subunit-like protein